MNTNNFQAPQLPQTAVITGALISMTDFVLDLNSDLFPSTFKGKLIKIINYAAFLKEPLKLEMFFPFDNDGNFMIEPKAENYFNVNVKIDKLTDEDKTGLDKFYSDTMYYDDAMEKVLFNGFFIQRGGLKINSNTVYITNSDGFDIASKTDNYDLNFIWDIGFKTIEDLVPHNIKLTDVAIKRIFG
jgi:hypothetical protein